MPPYTRYLASKAAEVERALLALSEHDRAAVIHAGLLSLDGGLGSVEQGEVDAAWRDEIGDRLDDVVSGRVELETFEQTHARLMAKYATGSGRPPSDTSSSTAKLLERKETAGAESARSPGERTPPKMTPDPESNS